MTDHIAAVRAKAEKEAEDLYPKPHREPKNVNQRASNTIYAAFRDGYVRGQVDLASRLAREKIAEAIHSSAYKTLDIEDLTDENYLELFDRADAILALLVDDTQR